MKSLKKFILAVLMFFMLFSFEFVNAEDKLAIHNSDVSVNDGTTASDAKYSFTLKANKATTVSYFTLDGNTERKYTDVKDFPIEGFDHYYYVSPNNNLSGKLGAWIKNVGTYQGKTVDVRAIYTWEVLNVDGTEYKPALGIGLGYSSGILAQRYSSVEISYELYSENEPLDVDMSFTFWDIDAYQSFGFKTNTGSINKIEAPSSSTVSYEKKDGYSWFYDEVGADLPDGVFDQKGSVRLELSNTNSFTVICVSGYDHFNYLDVPRGEVPANLLENRKNTYRQWLTDYSDSFISSNERYKASTGYVFFSAISYTRYTIPKPIKYVSDSDEKYLSFKNSLKSLNEEFSYDIYAQVPQEEAEDFYSSFKVEDTLPDEVTYVKANVYNDGAEDVTSKFNITYENNLLTVSAKNTGEASFYNNTYDIRITVTGNGEESDVIKNKATVIVERDNNVCDGCRQDSNETETTYSIDGPYIIETEVVNGTIDPSQTVSSGGSSTINYKPKDGYTLSSIEIDGKVIDISKNTNSYTFLDVNSNHKIKVVYISNPKTGGVYIYFVFLIALVSAAIAFTVTQRKHKMNDTI